jgi:hypothetical protein
MQQPFYKTLPAQVERQFRKKLVTGIGYAALSRYLRDKGYPITAKTIARHFPGCGKGSPCPHYAKDQLDVADATDQSRTVLRPRTKIDLLPPDIRDAIDRKLITGETYDEIADWLQDQGYDISRSTVGRFGHDFFKVWQVVRKNELKAKAFCGEDIDALDLEQAVSKMLMSEVFEQVVDNKVKNLKTVSDVLKSVAQLQRSSVYRERYRDEIRKAAMAEAAQKARAAGRAAGLSDEALNEIDRALGVLAD